MDFLSILSSVSKIAIVAFVVTLGIVLYELYVFFKSHKREKVVDIPVFSNKASQPDKKLSPLSQAHVAPKKHLSPNILFLAGGGGILLFLLIAVFMYNKTKIEPSQENASQETQQIDTRPTIAIITPTNVPMGILNNDVETSGDRAEPKQGPSPTTQPSSTPNPSPTASLLTPTSVQTTIILAQSNLATPTGLLTPTRSITLTVTPTPNLTSSQLSITPTRSPTQSVGSPTSTISKKAELPQTGNVSQSIFILLVSVLLIAVAFVL